MVFTLARCCLRDSPCRGPPHGDECFLPCQLCLCHSDARVLSHRARRPDARTSGLFQQSGQPPERAGTQSRASVLLTRDCRASDAASPHVSPRGLGLGLSGGELDSFVISSRRWGEEAFVTFISCIHQRASQSLMQGLGCSNPRPTYPCPTDPRSTDPQSTDP